MPFAAGDVSVIMPIKKEDCKFCHGYWVSPEDEFYPFCSSDCRSYWQSQENYRKQDIYRQIQEHEKAIAELKAKL